MRDNPAIDEFLSFIASKMDSVKYQYVQYLIFSWLIEMGLLSSGYSFEYYFIQFKNLYVFLFEHIGTPDFLKILHED